MFCEIFVVIHLSLPFPGRRGQGVVNGVEVARRGQGEVIKGEVVRRGQGVVNNRGTKFCTPTLHF